MVIKNKKEDNNNNVSGALFAEGEKKNENGGGSQKEKAAPPQPKTTISEGALLEYRAKRLLFHMGYYPKVNIPVKTSQEDNAEDVTDIDVYGIYIHRDFRQKTIWVDCKSGKARPLERISWMMGLRQLFPVDDIVFIKDNVRPAIKEFARGAEINIVDLALLDKLENDFSVDKNSWAGSWNPYIIPEKINTFSKITVPTNDEYKRLANFLTYIFWIGDNYGKIKKCMFALNTLAKLPVDTFTKDEMAAYKWALYETTTLFTLAILNVCKDLYYLQDNERRLALYNGMVSGDIPIKKRTEILQASLKVSFAQVKQRVPDFVSPSVDPLQLLVPPQYFEALENVISRVIHNPLDFHDILRLMDLALMEYDLQDKDYDYLKLEKIFPNLDGNIRGMKTILHFVCQATGMPSSYYRLLSKPSR